MADPVDLTKRPENSDISLWYAQFLSALADGATQGQLDYRIKGDTADGIVSTISSPLDLSWKWYFASFRGTGLLAISGVQTQQGAANFWDGYLTPILPVGPAQQFNPVVPVKGAEILQQVERLGQFQIRSLITIGHSAGGCVAESFQTQWGDRIGMTNRILCTFGSPRWSWSHFHSVGAVPIYSTRWMVNDDPVPLLPPRSSDTLAPFITYGGMRIRGWDNYTHDTGGLSIDSHGLITRSELPPQAVLPSLATFVGFLFKGSTTIPPQHSINTYANYLAAHFDVGDVGGEDVPDPAPEEQPGTSSRRAQTRREAQNIQTIFHVAAAQNQIPLQFPASEEMAAYRQGRIWVVVWRDQIVIVAPSKKFARRWARQGNQFLRNFLYPAYVSVENVKHLMEAFLDEAGDPASQVKPTMQTTLPNF